MREEVDREVQIRLSGAEGARDEGVAALQLIRDNLRRTLGIAFFVGLVITAINEADVILRGGFTPMVAVKIVLNFVVPFVSSNLGMLAYARAEGERRRRAQLR